MSNSCGNCRYFEEAGEGEEFGECHRYAPRPGVGPAMEAYAPSWPPVRADEWCGEHVAGAPRSFGGADPDDEVGEMVLTLPVRARQAIERRGLRTMDAILRIPVHEWLAERNFGIGSMGALATEMSRAGVRLPPDWLKFVHFAPPPQPRMSPPGRTPTLCGGCGRPTWQQRGVPPHPVCDCLDGRQGKPPAKEIGT